MATGICPQCKSDQVYRNPQVRGERALIPITSWTSITVQTCICIDCGYFSEWVEKKDLLENAAAEKIRKNWQKVS